MKLTNYKINKRRKYKIREIRSLLKNHKQIWYSYKTRKANVFYLTMVSFHRLDIIPGLKKDYLCETYSVGVEKGYLKTFDQFSKDLLIDERHEFHSVEEIINYLDKKGYLKKGEWIKDETN